MQKQGDGANKVLHWFYLTYMRILIEKLGLSHDSPKFIMFILICVTPVFVLIRHQGYCTNIETGFRRVRIPIINLGCSWDRLNFTMGIPIQVRPRLVMGTGFRMLFWVKYDLYWTINISQHLVVINDKYLSACCVWWSKISTLILLPGRAQMVPNALQFRRILNNFTNKSCKKNLTKSGLHLGICTTINVLYFFYTLTKFYFLGSYWHFLWRQSVSPGAPITRVDLLSLQWIRVMDVLSHHY